jgi:uncharacterized protein (TIGR03435 family)
MALSGVKLNWRIRQMTKIALLGLFVLSSAAAQQPKFGLADVRVSTTPRWFGQNNGGSIRDGRYIHREASMLSLIEAAYSVTEDSVADGPGWLDTDLFDVIAKVPQGTTLAAAKVMLQSLLAERFGLVIHQDTRPMPHYVLTVGKGGSKLKPAAAAEGASGNPGCRQQMAAPAPGAGGVPNLKVSCHNLTSQQIVDNLRQMAGSQFNTYLPHDVTDSTKLEGAWDFDLEFTMIGALGTKGPDGISLFDAVSKQLGLSLELKDVPVEVLVVESVDRKPTANAPAVATELATAAPRFEAASIKPVAPDRRVPSGLMYRGGSEITAYGTMHSLMALAFQIQPNAASEEIIGLPKSADSQIWEITAKLPSSGEGAPIGANGRPMPPQRSVLMEMLRALLADQFEMKTHRESREATVLAMTLMPGKPRMTQAKGTERMSCKPDPAAPRPFPNMSVMVRCTNITMDEFAENLEQATGFFDHPIVNATGLKGGWNFLIGWSAPVTQMPPMPANAGLAAAPEPAGLTSYEAVERQLGVKLVKQKRSVSVVVVDHVDEKPVE